MKNKIKRSPLFYVGDKFKLIPEIKKYFPKKIDKFVEPFVGGGSVFLNIDAKEYLLNDIDKYICLLHNFLINNATNEDQLLESIYKVAKKYNLSRSFWEDVVPKKLKKTWIKTYYARYNKEGYVKLRKHFNQKKEKDYLELYVLLIYGFNRFLRFNSKGEFNLPVGNVDFNKNVVNALSDYFSTVKGKKIQFFNLDYKDFIESLKLNKNDFVYLDPPYIISFSEYNKLWNLEKERELLKLLDLLNSKKIRFAISNVVFHKNMHNDIFKLWMKKYKVYTINSNYISFHDNSKKQTDEVLVTNY